MDRQMLKVTRQELSKMVTALMIELGISKKQEGYRYVREAIIMTWNDFELTFNVMEVYSAIAKKFGITKVKVIQQIANVIRVTWSKDPKHFKEFFGNPTWNEEPSNTEFIAIFVEKIRYFLQKHGLELNQNITSHMIQLGIPANLRGYYYIYQAIIMAWNDFELIFSVTKQLYSNIANKFETSDQRVEKSIRDAIEATWSKNPEYFKKFFGNPTWREKPSNAEFIATFVEKIKYFSKSKEWDLDQSVTSQMIQLGISANFRGYYHMRKAIIIAWNNHGDITHISKEIYPDIAKSSKDDIKQIESSIRSLIIATWNRNPKYFKKFFGNSTWSDKPSAKEVIEAFVEKIKATV